MGRWLVCEFAGESAPAATSSPAAMGKCFSAMKGDGSRKKTAKMARPSNSNHMGPEGVENSIFLGKDEPLFPKRDPAAGSPPPPPDRGDDVNAELAPLNELVPNQNGAGANGDQPPPPKQAVMRRSFPPVGVTLLIAEPMTQMFADPQRMAEVQNEITQTVAGIFMTQKERFRIMQVVPSDPPASVTIQMNIVADRSDNDMRSPMQLAAELVTQSKTAGSQLRSAPVLGELRDGFIAEDPFPGTKQDSWAGGVATLRPSGAEGGGEGKKKKKSKAGASGGVGAAPAAANQEAAAVQPGAQANGQESTSGAGAAAPVSPMHRAAAPAPVEQVQQTEQEMAASNTSDLPGGTIIKDGGQYTGELQEGQRHGRGKQHYRNGDVFTGCFQKDKRFGIGRLDLADGGGFYLGVSHPSSPLSPSPAPFLSPPPSMPPLSCFLPAASQPSDSQDSRHGGLSTSAPSHLPRLPLSGVRALVACDGLLSSRQALRRVPAPVLYLQAEMRRQCGRAPCTPCLRVFVCV